MLNEILAALVWGVFVMAARVRCRCMSGQNRPICSSTRRASYSRFRLHRGMLLTYPYPAPRGYGTRGLFVGIYTINTRLEWIEEDILAMFEGH